MHWKYSLLPTSHDLIYKAGKILAETQTQSMLELGLLGAEKYVSQYL